MKKAYTLNIDFMDGEFKAFDRSVLFEVNNGCLIVNYKESTIYYPLNNIKKFEVETED